MKSMEKDAGLKIRLIIRFCLSLLIFNSCQTKNENNLNSKTLKSECKKPSITVKYDFEKIKTYLYLVCKKDTLDKLVINECYANGGKLITINDSLSLYEYNVRGGIGIERNRSILISYRNNILTLFNIISKENFTDNLFPVPTLERECKIKTSSDSIILEWIEIQNGILKFKKKNEYFIKDLILKKEKVIKQW